MRPLHHRSVFTTRTSIYLIAGSWIPVLSLFLYDVIGYSVGSVQVGLTWDFTQYLAVPLDLSVPHLKIQDDF